MSTDRFTIIKASYGFNEIINDKYRVVYLPVINCNYSLFSLQTMPDITEHVDKPFYIQLIYSVNLTYHDYQLDDCIDGEVQSELESRLEQRQSEDEDRKVVTLLVGDVADRRESVSNVVLTGRRQSPSRRLARGHRIQCHIQPHFTASKLPLSTILSSML